MKIWYGVLLIALMLSTACGGMSEADIDACVLAVHESGIVSQESGVLDSFPIYPDPDQIEIREAPSKYTGCYRLFEK